MSRACASQAKDLLPAELAPQDQNQPDRNDNDGTDQDVFNSPRQHPGDNVKDLQRR